MKLFLVEPKQNKFSAYHFDGSEKSAKEAVDRWDCIMSKLEETPNSKYKVLLNTGSEILPDNYIILENKSMTVCSQSEFIQRYNIVYDGDRYSLGNFMSED